MAVKTIEAQLVLGAKDGGATAAVNAIVKSFEQAEKAGAGVSKSTAQLAKTLLEVEKAQKAVDAVMGARSSATTAAENLQRVNKAAGEAKTALDKARAATAAFEGVKPVKGTEMAKQMSEAAKALALAEKNQKALTREVTAATKSHEIQTKALHDAERAATALNVPLRSLEQHQRSLKEVMLGTTDAMRKQIQAERELERATSARQARRDAWKGAAGLVGLGVVHKAEHFGRESLRTYQHYDNERRFGRVVMGLTDEQQQPLVDQAIHMGATSRYNDVKVLHAQRELAARGLNREQILGMIPHVKDLGQALDIDIGDAAKQVEAGIFAFKKDISSLDAAAKSAKQTADVQVKAAKISGMTPEDIQQAYKYGATPARMAHVSEERMLAFAGVLKKATIGGDEAGVAFRALMATANAPTAGAKVAMRAAGMDYNKYQKAPDELAVAPFVRQVAESYGVKLDAKTRAGLANIFKNKALVGDSTKFTPAVMDLLSDSLNGDDAKSKKSIAGLANRYRNASMQGVDTNKLIDDLLPRLRDNLPLANALFGAKQGGRISTALGDAETFEKMQHLLKDDSAGYASKVSDARMEGFDGAVKRFEGAITNLETKLGRAWDNDGKGGFLTDVTTKAGQLVQSFAEMDNKVVQVASGLATIGSGLVAIKSVGLLSSGFGLKGSAVALDHSALALEAAAVKLGATGGGLPPGAVPGAEPGKPPVKRSFLGSVGRVGLGVAGAFGLEPLAQAAQDNNILKLPQPEKEGWGRAALNFLDPNLGTWVLGEAKKTGAEAGQKAGDGVKDGIKEKTPEAVEQAQSLYDKLKKVFENYIPIKMSFEGGGTSSGGVGGLIQRASFSTGGDDASGSYGGTSGYVGSGVGRIVRGRGVGGSDGLKGTSAFEGARTANQMEAYKAARAAGLSDLAARVLVANVSGESIDNPRDYHWDSKHTAEGIFQHDPTRAGAIAKHFGKRLRDMSVTEQINAGLWEMRTNPAYRRSWEALQNGTDPGDMLRTIISNHERPQDIGAALRHRIKLFNRFRPGDGDVADASGLRVKGGLDGQAFGGGDTHGGLVELAKLLQGGGGVDRFTGFNDRFHAGTGSRHARGLAMDITGNATKILANARAVMEVAGLVEGKDFKVINEYAQKSRRWTGGHVHFEFGSKDAADRFSDAYGKRVGGREIPPEPSPEARGGNNRMGEHVDNLGRHIDRLGDIQLRSHHTVEVQPGAGLKAKTRHMRIHSDGPVRGNVGVSMPQTEVG